MSTVKGRFIEPDSVTSSRILLNNNTALRSKNAAGSSNVELLKLDTSDVLQLQVQTQIATTPSATNDVVNKSYVDLQVGQVASTWLPAALDGPQNTPPTLPNVGDRYLVGTSPTGAWSGKANNEATYTVLGWVFTAPVTGNVLNVNTYTSGFYYWNGSAWVTRDFEKTTASLGLIKVGADIQPNYEVSNPTLKNSSGYIAVNLDGSRAITTGSSGIGVNVEASSPSLQCVANELGIKFDTNGGLQKTTSGVSVKLESSSPTLQIATNQLGVKLNPAGAVVTSASGVGVSLESSNPSLQIATNQLGVKLDASGAIISGASGVAVQLEASSPTLQIATNRLGVKLDSSGAIVTGTNGVAVALESSSPSLQISGNQLGVKLDPAGAVIKGTSGVAVQLEATNPTLQISTNRLGVKLNAAGAVVASASGLIVQVDGTTLKINGSNQLEGVKPKKELFTLTGTDITNGYINLTQLAFTGSTLVFVNGLLQNETADYTVSTVSSVTRITFTGDLTATGTAVVAGDKVVVAYSYL